MGHPMRPLSLLPWGKVFCQGQQVSPERQPEGGVARRAGHPGSGCFVHSI